MQQEPQPIIIIDPPAQAYRLDFEVSWAEGTPAAKDSLFYLYNANGSLDRITRQGRALHSDSAQYLFGIKYDKAYRVEVLNVRANGGDITQQTWFNYNGKVISTATATIGTPQPVTQKYYVDDQYRLTYAGDTSYTGTNSFIQTAWSGSTLMAEREFIRTAAGVENVNTWHYVYSEQRSNPYWLTGLAIIKWQTGNLHDYGYTLSYGLIQRIDHFNKSGTLFHRTQFDWTFNEQNLPASCVESRSFTATPETVEKTVREFHYSKR